MTWSFAVAGSANNKWNQLIFKNRITVQEENNGQLNKKAKRIRNAHRAFVQKTMEGATRILVEQTADHVEDSSREKLMGLKFTLNERLETIQKLEETILENTKGRDIKNEVEDSGEFCTNVYRILARIDWQTRANFIKLHSR